MDAYLAKFGITYAEWIGTRYKYGQDIPDDRMCLLCGKDYQTRYVRYKEISGGGICLDCSNDYRTQYICGNEIPDSHMWAVSLRDYGCRYAWGYEIPPDKMCLLRAEDYRRRYKRGHEIPPDKMCLLHDDDYRERFRHGHEIPADKMCLICVEDHQERASCGFDPENRSYKLSYLLGYRTPNKIDLELTDCDRAIHYNLAFNEACILALAGLASMPIVIPGDFEYVTGLAVPKWLELRMPTGEVAFRAEDPANNPAANVSINQVCDGLCSPEWGARRVGEMRGVITLAPSPTT